MVGFTPDVVPLAIRVRNNRYDGMITGYVHGGPRFQLGDVGGFLSASFTVDRRLGFRDDIIQPYSRIYFYNPKNGRTIFEGDTEHAGRSTGTDGPLLDVQVRGAAGQLEDWQGPRIFIDRDMESWVLTSTATVGSQADPMEDRGGSGADSLGLSFPNSFHVETNYRSEIGYYLIRETGQELGAINYSWDGGHTSGSPGWLVRSITTPPSTICRTQILDIGGSGGSLGIVGGCIPNGANVAFLQLIWTSGSSNTGTADNVWASIMNIHIQCRLHFKDGSFVTTSPPYLDNQTCDQVVEELLGTVLASSFDGPNARVDLASGYPIRHLAYPDGTNPKQVLDDLMVFEAGATYLCGPSKSGVSNLYSFQWISRSNTVRYEFSDQLDDYNAGPQAVDQYNEAVTRYKSSVGLSKSIVSTQPIPEMDNMGRTRRIFQDLGNDTSNVNNATQANAQALADHRFPQNGGQIKVQRRVVDLWTGQTVEPHEIQPAYICRILGIAPSRDALNSSPRNGSTLVRIVTNDYDASEHAATLSLDQEPWSMYKAIAKTKTGKTVPERKAVTK